MEIVRKIFGIILVAVGLLLLLLNYAAGDPVLVLTAAAVLLIVAGFLVMKRKRAKSQLSEASVTSDSSDPIPSIDVNVVDIPSPTNAAAPLSADDDNAVKYSFNVAGVSYHEKELKALLLENDDYDMSKRDLVDSGMVDERIYKYIDGIGSIALVPDPGNAHDPDAIKVIADDVLIGYVPREKTKRVRKIIDSKDYSVAWDVVGGPYKIVVEDYDDERDREVYSLERESMNLGVKVVVEYKK